jgi:ABC-type xylose transport system permease subunit
MEESEIENNSEEEKKKIFWDKTDRIAVMTVGGAALGGAIGLIPGAIAGATVAALYGWYIGFGKRYR